MKADAVKLEGTSPRFKSHEKPVSALFCRLCALRRFIAPSAEHKTDLTNCTP